MEKIVEFSAEQLRTLFGENDRYLEKTERELNILLINRDGVLKVIGKEDDVTHAVSMMNRLLGKKDSDIEEQRMNYAIDLSKEKCEEKLTELDENIICHTMLGKPVKPKTIG